ncbi:MAG: hypothetical protein Q8P29_02220 [Candidatus Levybacteria bacterium]|nr:hypothetical protein [Candidatus Levybacteria bacterium]
MRFPEESRGISASTAFPTTGEFSGTRRVTKDISPTVKKKGKHLGMRIALVGLATLGAIEAAGAITTELTNNQPISIVRTIPDDLKWPVTLIENLMNQKVPEKYDPKDLNAKFGENNISEISVAEAENNNFLTPKLTLNNDRSVTVATLMPGIFPSEVPDTQIKTEIHPLDAKSTAFVEKHFIMPEGFQLTIPKGVHYAMFKADPVPYQKPDLVYSIVTFFYDPINDLSYHLSYETTGGFVPGPEQKLFDREEYNRLYNPAMGGDSENLPISDGRTPIAKPSSQNQKLDMGLFVKTGKIEPNASLEEAVSKSVNATWQNVVDQNQKLILISSK